jgi:hypothetical protein
MTNTETTEARVAFGTGFRGAMSLLRDPNTTATIAYYTAEKRAANSADPVAYLAGHASGEAHSQHHARSGHCADMAAHEADAFTAWSNPNA